MKIAIIGGGASGFFSAIVVKENYPNANVTIFEKGKKVLAKVSITGGGRCNLTNACSSQTEFAKAYPRGEKILKKAFNIFDNKAIIQWFEKRGVHVVTQDDNCVFPKSQNSQTIIDCLVNEAKIHAVNIKTESQVKGIINENNKCKLIFLNGNSSVFDKIIVTTGGSPKLKGLDWLAELGHKIEPPVPSLFTFNMPKQQITQLMGVVLENALVNIQGTKLKANGPLLITHWGMSGPAILKLSSYGARLLSEKNYDFNIQVNWVNKSNNEDVIVELKNIVKEHSNKKLSNYRPFLLPDRLWQFLLNKIELPANKIWGDLGKKGINKLTNILTNDVYNVKGKTTFKDEFVTCGGVSLSSINTNTFESKYCNNLYFAGEVLDIDGITGGYNLQAAWTTGFIAGKLI